MLGSGTIVGGYRVDGTLGEGGMGVVYRATQLSLNRTVALKVLATELSEDPTFRERFRREGLLQAAIEHPHIVTVYEAGETEHGLFLAMRMVRGPTLKDRVQAGNVDQAGALRILQAVAEALDAAHEVGLTHRDVKPQNILIGARDHAYLADFGLTNVPDEAAGRLTGTGQFIGTIDYVSPEQVRGEGATSASDVYALAGVLYECLTGEVPYPRPTEAAALYAHISEPPPKVTEKRGDLPAEIDDVIARGMAKDPDERHPTAADLMADAARALGAAVTGPGPARPVQAAPRAGETAPSPAAAGGAIMGVGESTVARDIVQPGAPTAAASVPAAVTSPAAAARAPARPAERGPSRGLVLGGAAVLLVIAAVAGIVLGGSGTSDSEEPEAAFASSASAGGIDLSFPDDWSRRSEPADIPGLALSDEITLAPEGSPGAFLAAGTTNGSGVTLLPRTFLNRLPDEPSGEPVRIGELQAFRYTGLQPEGGSGRLTLYTAPTSAGVATIACQGPAGAASGDFLSECERVAATVQLTSGRALPLGPSENYARAVNAALTDLDSAKRTGSQRLRSANTPDAQAAAARALAAAYERAATGFSRAPAGPAERDANRAIVAAARNVSAAYERLAGAAAQGDGGAYSSASAAIENADARLTRALRRLESLGYDVA